MQRTDDHAVLRGTEETLFNVVSEGATPEQWCQWLRVPLEHAAALGDLALVNKLLEAGANSSAGWSGCDGRSLLGAAAEGGNADVVSALLLAGAGNDMSVATGTEMRSPLHRAALRGHDLAARELMLAGSSVHVYDIKQQTPLHLAVASGCQQLVENLIICGADPNAKDSEHDTPIHLAAKLGYEKIVRRLLRCKGCEMDARNNRRCTPLILAAQHGNNSTAEALLIAGARVAVRDGKTESSLDLAAAGGHVDVLKTLIRYGADVNAVCPAGNTALCKAAERCPDDRSRAIIDALVEAGADVGVRYDGGMTPLHEAAGFGRYETALALLRNGANVHAQRGGDRHQPLHQTCQFVEGRSADVADLLLRWGADEMFLDNEGSSPIQIIGAMLNAHGPRHYEEEADRIERVLDNALVDRIWRRRGLFVMCRAYPDKTSLLPKISQLGDGMVSRHATKRGATIGTRSVWRELNGVGVRVCNAGRDASGDESCGADEAAYGSFFCLAARVVVLEDGIFRNVVLFL